MAERELAARAHRGGQGPARREGLGSGDGRPAAAPRDPALHRGPARRLRAALAAARRLDGRRRPGAGEGEEGEVAPDDRQAQEGQDAGRRSAPPRAAATGCRRRGPTRLRGPRRRAAAAELEDVDARPSGRSFARGPARPTALAMACPCADFGCARPTCRPRRARRLRRMPRAASVHVCSDCGHEIARWHGRCPGCGEWNTLVEERAPAARRRRVRGARGRAPARRRGAGRPVPLARRAARRPSRACPPGSASSTACSAAASSPARWCCSAGAPGIGKSTLTNMVLGNLAAARPPHALRLAARSRRRRSRLRAQRLGRAPRWRCRSIAETDLDAVLGDARARAPRGVRDRLGADARRARAVERARVGRPGPRGRRRGSWASPSARGIAVLARRPRHQGRRARRPARARAPRRLRAAVRGRARAHLPHACARSRTASARPTRRASSRCARAASSRCSTPRRASSPQATRAPGQRGARARWRGRGRCWSRSRRSSTPSELVPPRRVVNGIDRNRLALVLAVLGRHGGVGSAARTCSSTSSAACASTSRAPTSRSRSRSPARPAGSPSAGAGGRRRCAGFGELGLTGELRWVGHPERRLQEAAGTGWGASSPPRRAAAAHARRARCARRWRWRCRGSRARARAGVSARRASAA